MGPHLDNYFQAITPPSFSDSISRYVLSQIDPIESCFSDKAASFLLDISIEQVAEYARMGLIQKSHKFEMIGEADLQFSNYWDILFFCVFRALERYGVLPSQAIEISRDLIDEASNQYDIEFDRLNFIDFVTEYFISAIEIRHYSGCATETGPSREGSLESVVNASLRTLHQRLLIVTGRCCAIHA